MITLQPLLARLHTMAAPIPVTVRRQLLYQAFREIGFGLLRADPVTRASLFWKM